MQYQLPVDQFRQEIEKCVEDNPVTIITAETGAGKSTRVPLWLWEKGKRVAVTQPRRIAARSLATYLASSKGVTLGEEIGYVTGFEQKSSKKTSLLYLTDGVQMIREIRNRRYYDVLILDEVHEWNLNQEVLMGSLKRSLDSGFFHKSRKRAIIMSATLQASKLSSYLDNAPVITVPGRGFPVTHYNHRPFFMLSDTVQLVEQERNTLVFLPGKKEIQNFLESLKETLKKDKLKAELLPLHSELPLKEQAKVFKHYEIPKVIAATDIAQTSITIDDIDAVIDSGIKKEVHDINGIEGLYPVEISNAECSQRAGRAGRVKSGIYILSSDTDMKQRQAFPQPEIRRLNIESAILKMISWGIDVENYPFFHTPKKNLLLKAMKRLRIFGAIDKDGKITRDGKEMANLPVSLQSARMVMEMKNSPSNLFEDILRIIAILEVKGIVNGEYLGERYYDGEIRSDLFNQLALWKKSGKNRKVINFKKLQMAKEILRELKKRLKQRDNNLAPPIKEDSGEIHDPLLRALITGFIDKVYVKFGKNYAKEDDERQPDRKSVLLPDIPQMAVGEPFDLIINREDSLTGEVEKLIIPLLTFGTELSIEMLDRLKPFSYRKEEEILVENSSLLLHIQIFLGNTLLMEEKRAPEFRTKRYKKKISRAVLGWYRENETKLPLMEKLESLILDYKKVEEAPGVELEDFQYYCDKFLKSEIEINLDTEKLDIFFKLNTGFAAPSIKDLLPKEIIQHLKEIRWPSEISISGSVKKVKYKGSSGAVELNFQEFAETTKESLRLPFGDYTGILMDRKFFSSWDAAAKYYNRWKKREVFNRKWKENPKSVIPEEIKDIPFPLSFEGGMGKNREKFVYYSAPSVKGNKLELIHFLKEEDAEEWYKSSQKELEDFMKKHNRYKIEEIFKNKGWKVK